MEKEKLNWKRLGITIFLILFTAGATWGTTWYFTNQIKNEQDKLINNLQGQIEKLTDSIKSQNSNTIVILTDKKEYNRGETIKINVKNNMKEKIFYDNTNGGFWKVEQYKGGQWIAIEDIASQIQRGIKVKVGDSCSMELYELAYPEELKSNNSITDNWNQAICDLKEQKIKNISSGQYRFSYNYGYELSDKNQFEIENLQIIYSNTFTIK